MANPSPTSKFKPGNNANPLGGAATDPKIKALKKLSSKQFAEVLEDFMSKTAQELEIIANDDYAPIHRSASAAAFLKARRSGSFENLEFILSRFYGKVPDRLADADGGSIVKGLTDIFANAEKRRNEKPSSAE